VQSSGVASDAAARLASKVTSISLNTKCLRSTRVIVVFTLCNGGLNNSSVACRGSPFLTAAQLCERSALYETACPRWRRICGSRGRLQPYCQI